MRDCHPETEKRRCSRPRGSLSQLFSGLSGFLCRRLAVRFCMLAEQMASRCAKYRFSASRPSMESDWGRSIYFKSLV